MLKNLRIIENKVLKQLEQDSRTPFSKMGKILRKSQQQISYTVNSLTEKKVLQNIYTIIDYSKLDIINFRVYFKVNYVSKENFDKLVNYIISDPHASWVATCSGRYDLICTFFTQNPSQFNKTLKSLIAKFPKELADYNVLTTIVNRYFGRKYLFTDNQVLNEVIFGGDREPETVDGTDMKILNELSEDARKSSVKIAEKLSINPKTVIQHIKKLQDREIILGFRPLLNPRRMSYISKLLLIKYHNISFGLENKLIGYLKVHPNVVSVSKTLGEWDIEIEIETSNSIEFRKVEMEIRQKFTLLIQQIESFSLYRTYKKNYFPKFLIKS